MTGFGPKQAWLAVRGAEPSAVLAALGLRDLGPVGWRAGMDLAHLTDDRVVVTPVIDGWVLVVGRWLWNRPVSVAKLSDSLAAEVHSYATHRGLEQHEWERAADGEVVRGFAYDGQAGEIQRWIGEPDAAEAAIGLGERPDDDADVLVGEPDVLRVAGAWSVDPSGLDGRPAPGPLRAAAGS